ncbi:MAG: LVIVD repeat-containing protein [Candidatus Promineifilaceae bacterium]
MTLPLAMACVAVMLLAVQISAQPPAAAPPLGQGGQELTLSEVGHLGGPVASVQLSGTLALVASGPELAALDLIDPAEPVRVSSLLFSEQIHDVFLDGELAFTTAGYGNVAIVETDEIGGLSLRGVFNPPGFGQAISAAQGIAYIATFDEGLVVVDVSEPAAPAVLSVLPLPDSANAVVLAGSTAFVATDSAGLQVVDVSDPAQPAVIGAFDTPGAAAGMTLAGGLLYLADGVSGLRILDVTQPAQPAAVGAVDTTGLARDVALSGNYAFVADGEAGLTVVDVTSPTLPIQVAALDTAGQANAVALSGPLAAVADLADGLALVDVSVPEMPDTLASWVGPVAVSGGIDRLGDYYFVGDGNQVSVVWLEAPDKAEPAGRVVLPGVAEELVVASGMAYAAAGEAGLQILDISLPQSPFIAGKLETGGFALDLVVSGTLAFIANYSLGLQVVDVSQPAAPALLSTLPLPDNAFGIAAGSDPDHVYLAASGAGLRVVDVRNPAAPIVAGVYQPAEAINAIAARGRVVFLAANGDLKIVSAASPAMPVELASLPAPGHIEALAAGHNVLYWAEASGRMAVIDVERPAEPRLLAELFGRGGVTDLFYDRGYLFAGREGRGLYIVGGNLGLIGQVRDYRDTPYPFVSVSTHFGRRDETNFGGVYLLYSLLPGLYPITPTLGGHAFVPAVLQADPAARPAGHDFRIVMAPTITEIEPDQPLELILADTQALTTSLHFPAGAVTQTTALTVSPTLVGGAAAGQTTGHALEIVLAGPDGQPGSLAAAFRLTVQYSDDDAPLVAGEQALIIGRWQAAGWSDAAASCEPPSLYMRDTEANLIQLDVCQPGLLALLGPAERLFVPMVSQGLPLPQ